MSVATKSAKWLYTEFGVGAVVDSGRDTWFVIVMRTCRMLAFGAVSLIFALFMSALGYSDSRIGLFMTATLAGDVMLSLLVTLVADRVGRRRVLFAGAAMMVVSGLVFVLFENYWILLFAAVVGVVSTTGTDFGPFRSIEESTLSHLTRPATRADVLSWYVTSSSLGSAVGTEISGRIVVALKSSRGDAHIKDLYHAIFWVYVATGAISMVLTLLMSKRCEIEKQTPEDDAQGGTQAAEPLLEMQPRGSTERDRNDWSDDDGDNGPRGATPGLAKAQPASQSWFQRMMNYSGLSGGDWESRSVIIKLWILLTIDSLADGMVSYSLTNYYLAKKFDLSEAYLGDIMSISYLLMAVSTVFSGPLARYLGLINTMVFTHLPSSAAVLFFPMPQSLPLSIVLLFIRTGLNNMDQGPRAAFIAAVVKPEERTAVMGITATLRTLAATIGPSLTGFLADTDRFWIAYVIAGALRIGYDLGLFYLFIGIKMNAYEPADEDDDNDHDDTAADERDRPSRGREGNA